MNGSEFTIVGVAPPAFDYPSKAALWVPTVFDIQTVPKEGVFFPDTIARIKPDIPMHAAAALFDAERKRLTPPSDRRVEAANWERRPHLIALRSQLAGPVERAAWVLAALTLLVLLTACANIGHLFLSRATERQSELALRNALGASRARLIQQLVTEALLLTASSAAAGLLFARWISHIATWITPAQLSTQNYTVFDWRVLFFSISLVVLTGLIFGIAPVWTSIWSRNYNGQHRTDAGLRHGSTRLTRGVLLSVQTAITFILLASSLVLGRSFVHLLHADLGFRAGGLLSANVSLEGTRQNGSRRWPYYMAVLNRVRQMPGIESASAVSYAPLTQVIFMAADLKLDSGQVVSPAIENSITPAYFRTINTPFIGGADFSATEWKDQVIVNQAFARATGLGNSVVGRFILSPWNRNQRFLIRGLVGTTSLSDPADKNETPQVFWALEGEPPPRLTFVARTSGDVEQSVARLRDAIRSVDPQVPVYDVAPLNERIDEALLRPKFYAAATSALTLVVFVLAAAGLFGAATYTIAQRQHEIGVRIAVGASPLRVRGMIARDGAWAALAGILLGLAGFLLSGNTLQRLIENAVAPGPAVLAGIAALLLLASFAATWIATARILRIDPIAAVRTD